MKTKKIGWLVVEAVMIFSLSLFQANAQVATEIECYTYPTSLPDVNTPEFGTARDNLLSSMVLGRSIDTHSRVGLPTGVEIRDVFDTGDMTVSTASNLWRTVFNPPAPYATQKGQRVYCPVLIIGRNGKVSIDRVGYIVNCEVALLSNASSLSGLSYSVSRVGILAGPDGVLFTPDDVVIKSGSGTNLVDAVAFIGGRVGAVVNQSSDYGPLEAEIGAGGMSVTFDYQFTSPTGVIHCGRSVMIYPRGQIPPSYNRVMFVPTPRGMVFSIVGEAGHAPITIETAREVTGPWGVVTTTAMEGSSVFLPYLYSTNDYGFVRLSDTTP